MHQYQTGTTGTDISLVLNVTNSSMKYKDIFGFSSNILHSDSSIIYLKLTEIGATSLPIDHVCHFMHSKTIHETVCQEIQLIWQGRK